MSHPTSPRRINARRFIAASALALGATGTVALAQDVNPVSPVIADQGGEAGEGGAIIDPGADLGLFLAEIDILEARTALLGELLAAGQTDEARTLLAIMKSDFEAQLEVKVDLHAEEYFEAFAELDVIIENGGDPFDAILYLQGEFLEVRYDVTPDDHALFAEVADLVRAATDLYAAATEDGRITNPLNYAQARAVLASAELRNQELLPAQSAQSQAVASEIQAQLALLSPLVASPTPPASEVDLSLFYGAAARVEISAGKVR